MIETTTFKVCLGVYSTILIVLAAVDILGAIATENTFVCIVHLIFVLGFSAAFMISYATKVAPRAPRIINIIVGIIHLAASMIPLALLPSVLEETTGQMAVLISPLTLLAFIAFAVSGFLAVLGRTDHRPSTRTPGVRGLRPTPVPQTMPGRQTPYGTGAPLPLFLEDHSRTVGVPGQGLHESGFSEDNVSLGVKGEMATAEILTHLLRAYPSAVVGHSMRVNSTTEADLDHVFIIGNQMIVVDSKMWKARRTYALGPSRDNFDDDVVEVWDGDHLDEFRHTAMPWMLREVAAQFPGYVVSGLICIHGVSESACASQSITDSTGDKRTPNLDLILGRHLRTHLGAIAAGAQFSPTDSAVISHLSRLMK